VDILGPDDFYSPVHQVIFETFSELFRKSRPMDLLTAQDELEKSGRLDEVGGAVYLAELAGSTVAASNAVHHARIVRDKSVQRQLISTSADIIASCFEGHLDVEELLDRSEQAIFDITEKRSTKGFMGSKQLLQHVFDKLTELYNRKEQVTACPPASTTERDHRRAPAPRTDHRRGPHGLGQDLLCPQRGPERRADYGVTTAVFSWKWAWSSL
jgi:replicative DNA helicase